MFNAILMSIVTILGVCLTFGFIDHFISINPENSYKSYRPPRPTSKTERPKKPQKQNWKTDSDGNITIFVNDGYWLKNEIIKKQDILELHDDEIKYSRIERHNNLNRWETSDRYIWCDDYGILLENKEDIVEYKTKDIWTYHYDCQH